MDANRTALPPGLLELASQPLAQSLPAPDASGRIYDCRPLSLATLENLLEKTGFQYQNICTQALRETLSLEGKKGIVSGLIAKLPDNVIDMLAPIIPTLIYRIEYKT